MRVYLIINPTAGKMKGRSIMFDIVERFCKAGYEVVTQVTLFPSHATELARQDAITGGSLIVCCGGDGTLNEVVHGVIESQKPIKVGYIPCGSTNDFAISLKLPTDVNKACDAIIAGESYPIDIGKFEDKTFTYIASFGLFTAVSYNTDQEIKNIFGHFAYVLEGIKDLTTLSSIHIGIASPTKNLEDDFIFGGIMNSTSVGGILKIDELLVQFNDGEFEVLLVRMPRTPIELNKIIQGITTSDYTSDMFEFFRASELDIYSDGTFDWSLDGEMAKGKAHIKIINLHNAINLQRSIKE